MPGGQSNFREAPGMVPTFLSSAEGLRYRDVDANEYLDFTLSMGAALWGYSDPEYGAAVTDQLSTLLACTSAATQTENEIRLAEALVARVPCAEWVRFGISGTEAVQLSLRLARGFTGRPLILRFEGHYHGWLDNIAGGTATDARPPHPDLAVSGPGGTAGRAHTAANETLMIKWNDLESLEAVLQAHSRSIAAVLMEAIMCNNGCCPPMPGYLQGVRELCDRYGVILIFDEVITGFRVAPGGAQDLLGVTPDLAVFGKALAGGLPLSAVAGREDIMMQLRQSHVMGGGTFNSFQLAVAAGVVTMDKLARDDYAAYDRMSVLQNRLADGLRIAAEEQGIKALLQGPTGVLFAALGKEETAYSPDDLIDIDIEKTSQFRAGLKAEGIMIAGGNRWFISPNHAESDIDHAIACAARVMAGLGGD